MSNTSVEYNEDEFLPIGSVVLLKGGNKRIMICGRIQAQAGSDIIYDYDDGISMMTKAHGLRVSAAIVPSEGTAMDVVEQVYQDLKAAGRQYDEQTLFQDAYNAEGNNACRLTVYYDGGRTRVTVLVAIEEREGCYLFKEMTCLPEEVDSEYQAVFKEMETTCGIEVSVMEDLGRHSQ